MRRLGVLLATGLVAGGCASGTTAPDHTGLLRGIVASAVQLHAERQGGGRRSASGVVVAADVARRRSWILTARHFLEPGVRQRVTVRSAGGRRSAKATVAAVSDESDLAMIELEGLALPPVALQDTAHLGDEVWVVAFPWGRRLTIVSGIVSQVASPDGVVAFEGPVRQVDALASYGASGGGVFDAASGRLIGIVEGYRTARVTLSTEPARTMDVPVPGETMVLPVTSIRPFLRAIGLEPPPTR